MKVAVVSTGLGHVARGIEAWSLALASGLANAKAIGSRQQAVGKIEVTLFAAAEIPASHVSRSCQVYHAKGVAAGMVTFHVVPCLKRGDLIVRAWVKLAPDFTWRWGWKSGYSIEQKSFVRHLIPCLKSGEYDLVHTQDPTLARELEKARKKGAIKTPVILAHGTDDTPEILKDITYLQHLCLDYRRKWLEGKEYSEKGEAWVTMDGQHHFCIPNFIDTKRFCPKDAIARNTEDQLSNFPISQSSPMRNALGIPEGALVIGCSAALQFHHKRLDYLIKEVSEYVSQSSNHPIIQSSQQNVVLLLAGASTDEMPLVEALAQELLGDRCKILKDLSFDEMPGFFRALDIYVHPAYDEFYSVSVLEAMASGVPVVAHPSPSLSEQVFSKSYLDVDVPSAGESVDMKEEGVVVAFLSGVTPEWVEKYSRNARERAEKIFSWNAVEQRFLDMYGEVRGKR